MKKINWNIVQARYVTGDDRPSYAALAAEFGVSKRQICRHAKAENWPSLRAELLQPKSLGIEGVLSGDALNVPDDPREVLESVLKKLFSKFSSLDATDAGSIVREIRGTIKLLKQLESEKADHEKVRTIQESLAADWRTSQKDFELWLKSTHPERYKQYGDIIWDRMVEGAKHQMENAKHRKYLEEQGDVFLDEKNVTPPKKNELFSEGGAPTTTAENASDSTAINDTECHSTAAAAEDVDQLPATAAAEDVDQLPGTTAPRSQPAVQRPFVRQGPFIIKPR